MSARKVQHLSAAVLYEDDPRAHDVARVVPRGVHERKVGEAVLGYHKPAPKRRGDFRRLRIAELKRIILDRHGVGGADTDDASLYLDFAAHHLPDAPAIRTFARRFTPGVPADEVETCVDTALDSPRRFTADQAALALGVRRAERDRLALRTIGATDHDAKARKAERAIKDREQKRAKRAASPKRQSLQAMRPWEAEGISRATWFRRQKAPPKARETKSVGTINKRRTADKNSLTRPQPRQPVRTRTYPRIVIPHVPAVVLLGQRVSALTARLARITVPLRSIAPDLRALGQAATIIHLRWINHEHHH